MDPMAAPNPYAKQARQYLKQDIETASKEQILIMLYEGAIRFLTIAKAALAQNDVEKYHNHLVKAQNILTELMTSLDFEVGGDIAQNLYSLYEYYHYRLIQANLKKDVGMVDEVIGHLRSLKATWEEAIKLAKQETVQDHSSATTPGGVKTALASSGVCA
jgi:flagellar protein FliS